MDRNDNQDLRAAEYVLGTLEGEERQAFARELQETPELERMVREWEDRLSPLADGIPSVDPPSELRQKIQAAIGEQGQTIEGTVTLRAAEGPWVSLAPGAEKKVLYVDRAEGIESYLVRIAPGARVPAHEHSALEECLMLEGEMFIGTLRLVAGDYHAVPAGISHDEIWSPKGALLYVRGELHEAA